MISGLKTKETSTKFIEAYPGKSTKIGIKHANSLNPGTCEYVLWTKTRPKIMYYMM